VTGRAEAGVTYCNVAAQARGLDPAGHAGSFDDAVLLETPLPWKREMYQRAGALPQQVIDLLALWLQRYEAGEPYNHRPLMIAPDPEYSRPGLRRVIFFTRPPGAFAAYTRAEYLAPEEAAGELIWAHYEAPARLASFGRYRVPAETADGRAVRDILVCTHGTIDVACGKFGYPLYRQLRDAFADEGLRVWRVSHFGGHVFAPTLIDMPTGHYWAYVGTAQAAQIVRRDGDVAALYGHYRGWAGLEDSFAQVAEREMWQREGWAWLDYAKEGVLAARDSAEEPQWAEVNLHVRCPANAANLFTAQVERTHTVETQLSTSDKEPFGYAQYQVKWLQRVARIPA
jgi:hypothetical protein